MFDYKSSRIGKHKVGHYSNNAGYCITDADRNNQNNNVVSDFETWERVCEIDDDGEDFWFWKSIGVKKHYYIVALLSKGEKVITGRLIFDKEMGCLIIEEGEIVEVELRVARNKHEHTGHHITIGDLPPIRKDTVMNRIGRNGR